MTEPPLSGGDTFEFDSNGEYRAFTVRGDQSEHKFDYEPFKIYVWNRAKSAQSVAFSVGHSTNNQVYLAESITIPPLEHVEIKIEKRDNYTYVIKSVQSTNSRRYRISADNFDCNQKSNVVAVGSDGEFESMFTSTMVACSE